MKISDFCRRAGASRGTVSALEKLGIVNPIRGNKGHRVFSMMDIGALNRFLDKQKKGSL